MATPILFYGLNIRRIDGSDPIACHAEFYKVVRDMRQNRAPALCVMNVARLSDHTNADDESVYRPAEEIRHARRTADPLKKLRAALVDRGIDEATIKTLEDAIDDEVQRVADQALESFRISASTILLRAVWWTVLPV